MATPGPSDPFGIHVCNTLLKVLNIAFVSHPTCLVYWVTVVGPKERCRKPAFTEMHLREQFIYRHSLKVYDGKKKKRFWSKMQTKRKKKKKLPKKPFDHCATTQSKISKDYQNYMQWLLTCIAPEWKERECFPPSAAFILLKGGRLMNCQHGLTGERLPHKIRNGSKMSTFPTKKWERGRMGGWEGRITSCFAAFSQCEQKTIETAFLDWTRVPSCSASSIRWETHTGLVCR